MGIIINQSLKLQDHEDKIRAIKKFIGLKAKLLGRIIKTKKEKWWYLRSYLNQN